MTELERKAEFEKELKAKSIDTTTDPTDKPIGPTAREPIKMSRKDKRKRGVFMRPNWSQEVDGFLNSNRLKKLKDEGKIK